MKKIAIYMMCLIVFLNTTSYAGVDKYNESQKSVKMKIKGYYFNKEFTDLFVYANKYLFHFSLLKSHRQYFEEILNQETPVMPEIFFAKVDSKGKVSARLRSNQTSTKRIKVNGQLLKLKRELKENMVSPKTLAEFYVKIPKNKTEKFLDSVASQVDYVVDNTGHVILCGVLIVVVVVVSPILIIGKLLDI